MNLSASLESRCTEAVARAATYIRGRQSKSGGFCFYQHGSLQEPNLGDTYYAVSALKICGSEVPNGRRTADFVGNARIFGLTYLYFCAFTLDRLGFGNRVSVQALEQIRALTVTLPDGTRSINASDWLESVRKTLRLHWRFESSGPLGIKGGSAAAVSPSPAHLTVEQDRYAELKQFVRDLLRRGGCGVHANVWDTYLALAIGSLLGIEPTAETRAFVDSLQQPPFGFLMTSRSVMPSLDVVYAGVRCCELLRLPVRYERHAIGFALSCQTSDGGFSHAPAALPNLEFTYRALQTLARLAPPVRASTAATP